MKVEFISQYRAALIMLESAIEKCPDQLWDDYTYSSVFWQLAYHALYFTDLYLAKDAENFNPWFKHRSDYHKLGRLSRETINLKGVYGKDDLIEYSQLIYQNLELQINEETFFLPSGFDWLPINKIELHFYNTRHLQHHTGELVERLHHNDIYGIKWITTIK